MNENTVTCKWTATQYCDGDLAFCWGFLLGYRSVRQSVCPLLSPPLYAGP